VSSAGRNADVNAKTEPILRRWQTATIVAQAGMPWRVGKQDDPVGDRIECERRKPDPTSAPASIQRQY
jgi:hypothetical protein